MPQGLCTRGCKQSWSGIAAPSASQLSFADHHIAQNQQKDNDKDNNKDKDKDNVSCHLPMIILLRKLATRPNLNIRDYYFMWVAIAVTKKWSTKTYVSGKRHCWWQKGKGERREVRKEVKCSLPPLLFHLRDFTRPKICQVEYFLNSVKMYAATSGAGQKNRGGKETKGKKRRRWEGTSMSKPFELLHWIGIYCESINISAATWF